MRFAFAGFDLWCGVFDAFVATGWARRARGAFCTLRSRRPSAHAAARSGAAGRSANPGVRRNENVSA